MLFVWFLWINFLIYSPLIQTRKIPFILCHGFTTNAKAMNMIEANLTAEGYPVVSLTSYDNQKSLANVYSILASVINEIRVIQNTRPEFSTGYNIVGHSLGGLLTRLVAEYMSDHKIINLYSLAGVQNGVFYKSTDDLNIVDEIIENNPYPRRSHPFSTKIIMEMAAMSAASGLAQCIFGGIELVHIPIDRIYYLNDLLPVANNVHPNENRFRNRTFYKKLYVSPKEKKTNFLRLNQAHFFYSEGDEVIRPIESAIFGFYKHQDKLDHVGEILPMTETIEYKDDTFGLRTLNENGRLFFHRGNKVTHGCWIHDSKLCKHSDIYDSLIYPNLIRGSS